MDCKNIVAGLVADAAGLDRQAAHGFIEIPPDRAMGDYALPCFKLSRQLRRPPQQIAEELRQKLEERAQSPEYSLIERCVATGGYLNIFMDRARFAEAAMRGILLQGERYGSSGAGSGKRVLVEFSAPNIAKPFHIGHMFSTVVGAAIERIYRFLGYETVALNHLGDWGTQFGKLISAYRRWGDAAALEKDAIQELLRVYVLFHREAKERPELRLDDEARELFLRLEGGDAELTAQWQKFRDLSVAEFGKVYARLGVRFDSYAGESFYSDKMGEVVSMLEQKGLLKDSEGAKIVDLSERGLQPCIIIKSDGATIYATRDLAAAIYRKREYDFHKSLYVVGIPQTLHFRQVFAILELLGFEWARDCEHIGFGQVRFPDRQMATREGEVIFLDDVMNEAVRRAAQMMDKERGVDEPEKVAESVGIGALVFTFLKNSRERDIIFSWDEMLDLEGDSGPYLQYTHARASSVLRKAGGAPGGADCSLLAEPEEYELICLMNGFAEAVAEAAQKCEPSLLARHVAAIARAFNKFYHYHKILDAPPGIREARLSACAAARALIGTGLALLGIAAPERM